MADDVRYVISIDDAKFIAAARKDFDAINEVDRAVNKLGDDLVKSGDGAKQSFDKGWASIGKIAAGITVADLAMKAWNLTVGIARDEITRIKKHWDDAAAAREAYAKGNVRAMGIAGALNPQQAGAIQTMAGKEGVTTDILQSLYGAYKEASPTATHEEIMKATGMIAPLSKTGVDQTAKAELAGRIAQATGYSVEKAVNTALTLASASKGREGVMSQAMLSLSQLSEQGTTPELAMATILSMVQKGYTQKQMMQLVGEFATPTEAAHAGPGRRLTEKQKIGNKLAAMTPDEKLMFAMEHPEEMAKFGGATGVKLAPGLKKKDIERNRQLLAEVGNVAAQQAAAVQAAPGMGIPVFKEAGKSIVEQMEMRSPEEAEIGAIRDTLKKAMEESTGAAEQKLFQYMLDFKAIQGRKGYIKTITSFLEFQKEGFGKETYEGYQSLPGGGAYSTGQQVNPNYDPQMAAMIGKLITAIQELDKKTQQQIDLMKGNRRSVLGIAPGD